jgi:hypothetical protein
MAKPTSSTAETNRSENQTSVVRATTNSRIATGSDGERLSTLADSSAVVGHCCDSIVYESHFLSPARP